MPLKDQKKLRLNLVENLILLKTDQKKIIFKNKILKKYENNLFFGLKNVFFQFFKQPIMDQKKTPHQSCREFNSLKD